MQIRREPFSGWSDCYRLSNGVIEAVVVADVGPRVVELRRVAHANVFFLVDDQLGGRGEDDYRVRGGWRLWVAPEHPPITCALDNVPCRASTDGDTLRIVAPPQPAAGVEKSIEVRIAPDAPRIDIRSTITNVSGGSLRYGAWSLAMMRAGGRAFIPLDVGHARDYASVRRLVLWSYTKLTDPRYRVGDRLVEIDQRVVRPARGTAERPDDESKLGTDSRQGWSAYLLDDTLVWKRFTVEHGAHPHGGATTEVFSNHALLELEHLGPLTTLEPGEVLTLTESWSLHPPVEIPTDEEGALRVLERYLTS